MKQTLNKNVNRNKMKMMCDMLCCRHSVSLVCERMCCFLKDEV